MQSRKEIIKIELREKLFQLKQTYIDIYIYIQAIYLCISIYLCINESLAYSIRIHYGTVQNIGISVLPPSSSTVATLYSTTIEFLRGMGLSEQG